MRIKGDDDNVEERKESARQRGEERGHGLVESYNSR